MAEIKTNLEHLIELRNKIAGQIVGQDMSVLYWREVAAKAKRDTHEKANANDQAAANQQLSSKDRVYLKIIDQKLKEMGHGNS